MFGSGMPCCADFCASTFWYAQFWFGKTQMPPPKPRWLLKIGLKLSDSHCEDQLQSPTSSHTPFVFWMNGLPVVGLIASPAAAGMKSRSYVTHTGYVCGVAL